MFFLSACRDEQFEQMPFITKFMSENTNPSGSGGTLNDIFSKQ